MMGTKSSKETLQVWKETYSYTPKQKNVKTIFLASTKNKQNYKNKKFLLQNV